MYGITEIAYELYKQDWIETHTTATQRLNDIRIWAETEIENHDEDMACSYEECREEFGYDGELYACYDEFLDSEYLDKEYMYYLLQDKTLIEAYEEYMEE